jgi:hypothetical protein
MEVDLTEDEIKLMTNLLEQRCEDLRVEVRRTETPSYHDMLRQLESATITLLRKLEKAGSTRLFA